MLYISLSVNNGILVVNNVSSIIFKLQKHLSNESVASNALINNVNSWLFLLIFIFQKNQVDSQKAMFYPTESYALLDVKHRDSHQNSSLYPFTCRFLIFSKPIIQPKKSGIGIVNQKVIAVWYFWRMFLNSFFCDWTYIEFTLNT